MDILRVLRNMVYGMFLITAVGCDAVNQVFYTVENRTDKSVYIRVPNFPTDPGNGFYSETKDSTIEIGAHEEKVVGVSPMDISFPWGSRRIYKETPGICGIQRVENDSVITLDCTRKSWHYRSGCATYKIK